MAHAHAPHHTTSDPIAPGRLHWVLRFGAGIAVAFVLSEAMGWYPTFLAPVLVATLLANLPGSPPFKAGLSLVLVMAAAALVAFLLPSLLRGAPQILFGAIALIVFLAFAAMAQGRARLPALLLLMCVATVPVIAMVQPQLAGFLPVALVRAAAVAVLVVWGAYALWPHVAPRAAAPVPAPIASPVATALMGTAIVMPLMLVYLMFGLTDALPVLVTTVLLVANLDPQRGAMHGLAMMLGNLIGGLVGVFAYALLQIAPSLITLALITFIVAMAFGARIEKGGPKAAVGLITCNSCLIILSSAILSGPSNSGIWIARLSQFALACTFAIGMMGLLWRNSARARDLQSPA
ncbi:DUF2955 domain-containing protein [Sphingomonas cavernae]|uniref:DUF2955 domain-containing protein n=1 Tax=Sphingomonas cavernae TaxID=2320861 RepID=A0A418WRL1_9SPHN|nr:DUF2955 domain-containing protein [Sphingomonas cavernae]RJF93851.1 DUF2955 domain-containing protein [Sphingomonas cavernae]